MTATRLPGVTVEAAFSVTPDHGTRLTDFEFDAGSSQPAGQGLEFRWDWEADGTWDTDWSTSTAAGTGTPSTRAAP